MFGDIMYSQAVDLSLSLELDIITWIYLFTECKGSRICKKFLIWAGIFWRAYGG